VATTIWSFHPIAAPAAFDAAHGWAANPFAVLVLASIGATFLTGVPRVVRWGVLAVVVLCLADWALVEDLGFVGGVATDPNSTIPMLLLIVAGYVAMARVPVATAAEEQAVLHGSGPVGAESATLSAPRPQWWEQLSADPAHAFRSMAAIGAVGITLVGVVHMALALTGAHPDPILAEAIDGTPIATDMPTPAFSLVDQHGPAVSLGALRGKAVALTFLHPVCTSNCPVIAQEFRTADSTLGPARRRTGQA
jgi:hypothetical protein